MYVKEIHLFWLKLGLGGYLLHGHVFLMIQGVTSASKQAAFMEQLIDMVCIADAAEDPQNRMLQEPGLVS